MSAVVPARLLFRWSWPVLRSDAIPAAEGQLLGLSERYRCASLSGIDGEADFADLKLAWNKAGVALAFEVRGKQQPLKCQPLAPTISDGVTIWLNTRATQAVHRATRFCRQFLCLPAGSGQRKVQPSVTSAVPGPMQQPRPSDSAAEEDPVRVWSELRDDGYLLEVWLPAGCVPGFDPENHRQLGFFYAVHDAELGDQTLTVDREFPFEHNPSLWQTLELCD